MDAWRLLPRPERVTELYFTDHRQLPAATTPEVTQTILFTVHNLEHQTTTYYYTLTAMSEDDTTEHPMGGGSFTLAHDRSLTTSKTVTLPLQDERIAVKVNVEYKGVAYGDNKPSTQKQSIHYWTATIDTPDGENREDV